MKIDIVPKEKPSDLQPLDLMLDEEMVGELKPMAQGGGAVRWHATICLPPRLQSRNRGFGALLFQGFGLSHDEAIADALESGRRDAINQRETAEAFARKVGYDFQPEQA